jgi:hypothetical protein
VSLGGRVIAMHKALASITSIKNRERQTNSYIKKVPTDANRKCAGPRRNYKTQMDAHKIMKWKIQYKISKN